MQGLRGLAVLLVVGFHTGELIPGGFIGVDVFFVVSGFVITRLLLTGAATGSVRIRDFMARRVQRLLPMLAVTLSATAALGVLLLSPLGASSTTSATAIAAALLNANTYLATQPSDYFALPTDANALLHTWSLSVEEQFYLVFPSLLLAGTWVLRRLRRGVPDRDATATRWMLAGVLGIALASFALYAFALGSGATLPDRLGSASLRSFGFYGAPMRAWEFLAGAALAIVAPRLAGLPGSVRTTAGVAGIALVLGCAALFDGGTGFSAAPMTLPVLGTSLLLVAGSGGPTAVSSLLSGRGPVWVGDRSYGWYLFHWPLIVFAAANSRSAWVLFAAAAASLGLAAAAKRPVEDRFRRSSRWQGGRALVLAGVCIAVPVAVGFASLRADSMLAIEELEEVGAPHVDVTDCNRRLSPSLPLHSDRCTWRVEEPRGRILLIGDSHAGMWAEAVIEAGNSESFDVSLATMSACALLPGTQRMLEGEADDDCARFVRTSIDEITSTRPDLVIIGSASIAALEGRTRWRSEDRGPWTSDGERIGEIWLAGMRRTVDELAGAGVRVALLRDIPYHGFTTERCGRLLHMVAPRWCASTMSTADFERQRAGAVAIEDAAVSAQPLATVIDPTDALCDRSACSTFVDGTWMYRNRDHLSVAGSKAAAQLLQELLARTLGAP